MVAQINCAVIGGDLCKKVSGACTSCLFEPIELQEYKPCESAQISGNDIGPHHIEHLLLTLQIVHECTQKQKDHACNRQEMELVSHKNGV